MKILSSFHSINKAARRFFIVLWLFSLVFFGGFVMINKALAMPVNELKENFRSQIDELEKQIEAYRTGINNLQRESKSLKREISLLDTKIKSAELEVRRTDLVVQEIENGLTDKNLELGQADLKLDRERVILANYLQTIYESDQQGTLEIVLSNDKLSDIFDRINSLQRVQESIQESMVSIRQLKSNLEQDRQALEDQREEANQLKVLKEIQRRAIAYQQEEKKSLLSQTKGQESAYQNLLKKAAADAESIKKNLYLLEGVGVSMSLEIAYQQAKRASDLTGVRPAFLLAVLKNESSWGEKVGTGTWRRDMNARDQQPFIQICESLNLDPDKMPVSRKPNYGWGGAMGPGQFLPAVWQAYTPQIAQLTGHNPPNPWDIGDAFVATGIKMAQAGANEKTSNAEWKAAQIYFAGKRWNNPTYYFYGNQVMELAGIIQDQLDIITR